MTQDLQQIIANAQASGQRVTIIVIDGSDGPPATHATLGDSLDDLAIAESSESPVPDGDPASWSPLERLEAAIAKHGSHARKEGEWAADICGYNDFSARELERACRAGAITSTPKPDGLDAGARMITGSDLRAFLMLREAVRQGTAPAPDWWSDVVPKRQRRAA